MLTHLAAGGRAARTWVGETRAKDPRAATLMMRSSSDLRCAANGGCSTEDV